MVRANVADTGLMNSLDESDIARTCDGENHIHPLIGQKFSDVITDAHKALLFE
jgi:hypothetical protein